MKYFVATNDGTHNVYFNFLRVGQMDIHLNLNE